MQALLRLWRTLEACPWGRAVSAEWRERFAADFAHLKQHLKPTGELATTYPCPRGDGDGCPRQVHERESGLDAVCGNIPAECPSIRVRKAELAVLGLDAQAALAAHITRICDAELLAPVAVGAVEGLLPLGVLARRAGSTLIVLASSSAAHRRGAALELRRLAGVEAVAVLVVAQRDERVVSAGYAELGIETGAPLQLHRALRLLWPESWGSRAARKEALFEDVELEFAATPERHIVRLNGEELKDFRWSDGRFARLIRLAAARTLDLDAEGGGWLKKLPALQLDEKENDLAELRRAFHADQPDGFANLTEAERRALAQTSTDRPGMIRLPLHPRRIRFDPSLAELRLLGDKQTEPKPSATAARTTKKSTGGEILARNQAQARAKALKMLGEARRLGVPLPDDDVLKGRSTEI